MSALTITRLDVTVLKNSTNKVKAYANVSLNDAVRIKGIKIIEGMNGLFVAMPSYLNKEGQNRRIAFFIDDFAKEVETKILETYQSKTALSKAA